MSNEDITKQIMANFREYQQNEYISSKPKLSLSKIRDVKTPTRGTPGSAGIDFYVPDDYPNSLRRIAPGERFFIPSGIKANVPEDHALIAFNKSGVALKKGLMVGACVVDSDYQGEIHLHLINTSNSDVTIEAGEKLTQFLLIPVSHIPVEVVPENELFTTETDRGAGGFGSTGTK
jgi:dUTP pyrophosphatase